MTGFNASRRALLMAVLVAPWVQGCTVESDFDHNDAHAPQPLDPHTTTPKHAWALVLGSGGPRGFVHVGVLRALEELGVRPPVIVGASVGALVGAAWAAGIDGRSLDALAMELSLTDIVRVSLGTRERFGGGALASFVNRLVGHRRLEQLPTPMIPVAARKTDRKLVGFNRGDIGVAVQASAAIEGLFTPVRIRGVEYIDADLISPVPVRFAKAHCARRVLSVDPSAHEWKAPERARERYGAGDLRKRALTEADVKFSDLNLHPEFDYFVSWSKDFRRRTMDAGYRFTFEQADKIRALVSA